MKYTSLKLNKLLAENGCELRSEKLLADYSEFGEGFLLINRDELATDKYYQAYDILNDICVKYAKEFFGKKNGSINGHASGIILTMLKQNKRQEAEDYIWEHCLFNPKNK